MLGIGEGELLIIVVFAFLLFGPDKLPQMGKTIGRALRQFRETQEKMTSVVQTEIVDPMAAAAQAPVKPKKAASSADDATDDDADVAEEKVAAAKKETFAERRARLAAEKAAREAEATQGEAPAEPEPKEASAPAAAEPAAAEPEAAEPKAEEAPAKPKVHTTADLYARRPRKHAAATSDDENSEATDASTTEGGAE